LLCANGFFRLYPGLRVPLAFPSLTPSIANLRQDHSLGWKPLFLASARLRFLPSLILDILKGEILA
jgi:hypothetical protein